MTARYQHTSRHGLFPEWAMAVTTAEPENFKAIVLSTRLNDWAIPIHTHTHTQFIDARAAEPKGQLTLLCFHC